jgi:membrane-bound lytic murein transglycosylase B
MRADAQFLGIVLFCLTLAMPAPGLAQTAAPTQGRDFAGWLEDFRADALARGISAATLEAALGGVEPLARVLELDQRQPEFVDTFLDYLERRVNARRIAQGQEKLREQRALLDEVQRIHGVPPAILIAFWGLETNYGSFMGDLPTPAALATLAWDTRRSAFFRGELLSALRIIDQGHIAAADMKGSWAGAMGQMQFMPSTFLAYAVDGDGDGRKDIWRSLPDAFHSAGNYLRRAGWRAGELWGREVRLPAGFDHAQARLDIKRPVRAWAARGVTLPDGSPLPDSDQPGAILMPQGHTGPAFLVYRNFEVIMAWNRSINYALSVGHLADRLQGLPALSRGADLDNRRLSRDQIARIQALLTERGFDAGDADGVPGPRTRAAIRAYQDASGLPADGHASLALHDRLVLESAGER